MNATPLSMSAYPLFAKQNICTMNTTSSFELINPAFPFTVPAKRTNHHLAGGYEGAGEVRGDDGKDRDTNVTTTTTEPKTKVDTSKPPE